MKEQPLQHGKRVEDHVVSLLNLLAYKVAEEAEVKDGREYLNVIQELLISERRSGW